MPAKVDPDQYHEQHGRCPRGYSHDGEKCVRTAPEQDRKGKGPDDPKEAPDGPAGQPERPKKKPIQPQGPQEERTAENPYGLAQSARLAGTAAELGGHEGLRKILGHMEPSKLPPPDIDPSTIRLNLDGDNDSKAVMTKRVPQASAFRSRDAGAKCLRLSACPPPALLLPSRYRRAGGVAKTSG
jgi:hypothetical protein